MKKQIIIITICLILIIGGMFGYFFINRKITKNTGANFMPAFSSKKNKSMFKQYKTEIKDFDGQKALQFKKIVATTADSDSKHFKLDILIIIKDNYQTDTMIKHNDLTFLIISKTLSMFSYQDVKTTEGKQLLKTTIKRELEKKFGSDTIIDIYFENFVYG